VSAASAAHRVDLDTADGLLRNHPIGGSVALIALPIIKA
jgi:hypothetical protein